MIYVDNLNLAFIHIPKNAGKSMRNALMQNAALSFAPIARDLQVSEAEALRLIENPAGIELAGHGRVKLGHIPLALMEAHFPETWSVISRAKTFALVRPPRDRFFSALLQYLGEYRDASGIRADNRIVSDEARRVCDWLDGRDAFGNLEYIHFSRQVDYVDLHGARIVTAVFPVDQIDAAARWIEAETGLHIEIKHDHARREPKKWASAIQPAARYVGRKLMPGTIKRALYPLWMNSGAFSNAAGRYQSLRLGDDVELFLTNYYARDQALYEEANLALEASGPSAGN